MLKRAAALLGGRRFLGRFFERQNEHGPVTEKVMTATQIPIMRPCQLDVIGVAKKAGRMPM